MKIKLTEDQIKEIEQQKLKEEVRLESIPRSGHGWDVMDCEYNICRLTNILKDKEIDLNAN
tara:strand:+ start:1332 stop:1514 length:183 start_codon:yes stop_codon:yes gene_type:complete